MAARTCLALGLAACATEAGPVAGAARAGLTGATEHDGRPAVGRLVFTVPDADGGRPGACTATLVGDRTVLVAAHCLGFDAPRFLPDDREDALDVAEEIVHPDYEPGTPWEHDLGLVVLSADVDPPIAPARVSPVAPAVGDPVTLVGFGETELGLRDHGVKRVAENDVHEVSALWFETRVDSDGEGNGCRGDSGGPALSAGGPDEAVVGVMSWVPDLWSEGCGPRLWSTRVDLYVDWLEEASGGDVTVVAAAPPDAGPPDAGSLEADAGPPDGGPPDGGPPHGAPPPVDGGAATDDAGPATRPRGDGGCALAAGPGGAPAAPALLVLVLVLAARRRRGRAATGAGCRAALERTLPPTRTAGQRPRSPRPSAAQVR